MDISIEEKKTLLRQAIRQRKKLEVEIKLNAIKKKQKPKSKLKAKKRDKKASKKITQKSQKSSSPSKKPTSSKPKLLSVPSLASLLGARWWYVLPPWPPANYNYAPALLSQGYREVKAERFSIEPEVDNKGLKKVVAVEGYEGVFSDGKGGLVDVRPREG